MVGARETGAAEFGNSDGAAPTLSLDGTTAAGALEAATVTESELDLVVIDPAAGELAEEALVDEVAESTGPEPASILATTGAALPVVLPLPAIASGAVPGWSMSLLSA